MSINSNALARSVCQSRRRGTLPVGFTLIELMIVVAIVAILAAIAYPAYTNSIIKGKRSEGRAALLGLLQQEERYFTQNNSYVSIGQNATTGTDASSNTITPLPFQTYSGSTPSQSAYNLYATTCAGVDLKSCVIVVAAPNFTDTITQLSIQSNGAKSCTVTGTTSASVCWGGS